MDNKTEIALRLLRGYRQLARQLLWLVIVLGLLGFLLGDKENRIWFVIGCFAAFGYCQNCLNRGRQQLT